MNLSQLKIGQSTKIISVNGEGKLRHRLLEMGLLPGTKVTLTKVAPFGDPLELEVRGYELSIRVDDARLIEIEEVSK